MSEIGKIEQGRASKAFQCVINHKQKKDQDNKKNLKDYKSYVKKLPMLIKVNGLASAIAFVYSKKNVAYQWLYEDISNWIKESPYLQYVKNDFKEELVNDIINLDSQQYRAVTKEVLTFLNWLKRFAVGQISDEANDNILNKEDGKNE